MANPLIRASLFALAVLALSACNQQDADQAPAEAAPQVLTAPPASDETAWRQYLTEVVKQNMEGIRQSPYMYYLPSASADPQFEEKYGRQLDNVRDVVARTVTPGNMLAFGSPESGRMADLVIEAFKMAEPGSFNDVRVLFIGKAEDRQRVEEAVAPSGADFVFHEAT